MKSIYAILICFFFIILTGCKTDKKEDLVKETMEISILEKIANAHGFKNWNKIIQLEFTFNVDRDTTHFERNWVWKPKTNDISLISGNDTLSYNRNSMDSIAYKTNAGFINDKYWLLGPFNLVWDAANFKHTYTTNQVAPISRKAMNKLTIVYSNEGGYTPGDAYDFYFENDYLIQEWVFRKANKTAPSMTTTWENYISNSGLKIAMEHKKPNEDFNLFFNNIIIAVKE